MGDDMLARHAWSTSAPESEVTMRLFKRSTPTDDAIKCPDCGERVPDGAHECAMCGHDLRPRHGVPRAAMEIPVDQR
jgi:rubredoxin